MKTLRCPTCEATISAETETFPFCSSRCKLADLGSWLDGRYVVAGAATEETDLPSDEELLAAWRAKS